MMMMAKTLFLSSIISKVRQAESDEERAVRLIQMRDHNGEVGNESNYINDDDDAKGNLLVIHHLTGETG